MISSIASFLRKTSVYLLSKSSTYYPGMMVVRLGRFLRERNYKSNQKADFHEIKMFGDIKISVDRYSYMGGSIFWTGFHHINEALFLKNFLKPQMTIVDIGANQGEFSLLASSIIRQGKVMAFEPVIYQRSLLEKNKELNKFSQLEIFPFGLSNTENKLPIFTSKNTTLHHGVHEGLSTLYSSGDRNELQEEIELKVFDELFYKNLKRLDFIKIDIEGAELYALQGMKKTIKKFLPLVLIEINEDTFNAAGYTTLDVIAFFKTLNYKFFRINKGKLSQEPISEFNEWGNYIAKYLK